MQISFLQTLQLLINIIMYTVFLRFLDEDFSFQNNAENLDLSYKMDLDLWDCLGRVKFIS